jgi:hypothetical protein
VLSVGKIFQFAVRVGVVRSAVQKFVLHSYEKRKAEVIRKNMRLQKKVLKAAGLDKLVGMKKLNY